MTFAALEAPAEPDEIRDAERAAGMDFPEALVESLRRHAGTGYHGLLPPIYWLLGPAEIARSWRTGVDIHERDPECGELADLPDAELPDWWQGPWWHRRWLPFAADGCGGHLVIDQRPHGRPGRIGAADKVDGGQFHRHPMWTDLPTLLARFATAIETGEPLHFYEPVVTEQGVLKWEIL